MPPYAELAGTDSGGSSETPSLNPSVAQLYQPPMFLLGLSLDNARASVGDTRAFHAKPDSAAVNSVSNLYPGFDKLQTHAIRGPIYQVAPIIVDEAIIDYSYHKDSDASLSLIKVAECRICQDEDFDSNMEAPCSCSGSLKYAHRRCVQKWCNEKGDTMCEICHQQFKPGYTAPPPIFRFGGLPMNLRGNWQIARRDLNNPRIIAMVSTDHSFLDPEYDEYAVSTSRSIVCCRTVAIIFMVLLILRHTLPVIVSRAGNYSLPLIILLMLRVAGIILPICIILKAVTSIIRRRQQQQANSTTPASDEESSSLTLNQPSVNAVS